MERSMSHILETSAAIEESNLTVSSKAPAETIIIRGRKVVGGVAEGEAMVTSMPISGWGGVDPRTGTIVETRHELRGQSFAGKVLVFPGAKGSSGWSAQFHVARVSGTAPAAWLFNQMTTKVALGVVVSHAPAMTDFDIDPLTVIRTGDWVRVDADAGVVTITRGVAP
jgi:predicted aconitase with swiveling domain